MKWIGQNIYDLVSRFRSDVYLEDISSGTIASGGNLGLDSNNKIVKATEASGDLTGITAGTGLSGTNLTGPVPTLNVDASQTQITGVGTITTGEWRGTAIASAYLDGDTAHLSQNQTFDGIKSFTHIASAIFDGDKSVAPGDGSVIHVDSHDITDNTTSGSGTAAMFTHVNIENPRLLATNSSVTTTNAATLYVKGAPAASTNQTITNAYALWVDDGLVKFDGALTVDGTITGNVTGNASGTAATVTGGTQAAITSAANLATVGTIGTGVWNGDVIASAYLDADTAHLSGTQTFTGAKTFGKLSATSASDLGSSAVTFTNADVDQIALDIDASNTTANIIDVSAADLTTGNVVNIDCNSLTTGSAINLDIDDASTANHAKSLINIDYDKSGVTAGGSTNTTKGLNINLADAATNHAGGYVSLIGAQIDVDIANNTGAITQKGLVVNVAVDDVRDAATTTGVELTVADGSTAGDLKIMSSADTADYFSIKTATAGSTSLLTIDSDGGDEANLSLNAEGVITLSSNGDIVLSPSTGNGVVLDATITADGGSLTGITTLGVDSVSLTAVQTSAESFTNNDTSIMTSAAIEDKIQAHYAVSYITFTGQATMLSSGNWVTTGAQGISNHSWNQDMGVNTETNNSSQGSLAKQYGHMGVRMPSACTITKLSSAIRNAGGNRQVTIGLFCARATDSTLPAWGTTTATEPKLQIHADANDESGSYANRPTHAEVALDVAMAAGDMFYPAIKLTGVTSGGNTDNVYASFTVEIKTLIV